MTTSSCVNIKENWNQYLQVQDNGIKTRGEKFNSNKKNDFFSTDFMQNINGNILYYLHFMNFETVIIQIYNKLFRHIR